MKKFYLLLTLVLFTFALFSCGESVEKYNPRAKAFIDSLSANMELTTGISQLRTAAWNNAIYYETYQNPFTKEYKMDTTTWGTYKKTVDFNTALMYLDNDLEFAYSKIKNNKIYLDSIYSTLKNPPSKSEKLFDNIKTMYTAYSGSFKLALSGAGYNYQQYNNEAGKVESEFRKAKNEFEIEIK